MACTGIELVSEENNPFWGRTQDFEQHFEYSGVKISKGFEFKNAFTPYKSETNVMGIVWSKDIHDNPIILDGINDYGICGGSFYFDHFYKYVDPQNVQEGKKAIRGEEICTWILTHYKSLDDIKMNLNKDVSVVNVAGKMMDMSVPQHCTFCDETGRSIVVEPSIENGFKIFENTLGVFTNAPTFDWHLNNLKNWLERTNHRNYTFNLNEEIKNMGLEENTSGLVGIPADYKPESRFLRAAYAKLMSVKVHDDNAINQIFQLLTTVNTPKGLLRIYEGSETKVAWTQYTAAYDIKNKRLFAFTYDNQNIRELDFGDVNQWKEGISYYSFISKQTYEPFILKNTWNKGENTL